MFLSTVIPSTRLNINAKNIDPYQFTVPYNFVRGRNISLTINPLTVSNHGYSALINNLNGIDNNIIIKIPDAVTSHTANMTIKMSGTVSSQINEWNYNVNITCDTVQNTITITPMTTTPISGQYGTYRDDVFTWPVLLTIATIL